MAACGVSKGNLISLRNFIWIYFQRDLANEVIKNLWNWLASCLERVRWILNWKEQKRESIVFDEY